MDNTNRRCVNDRVHCAMRKSGPFRCAVGFAACTPGPYIRPWLAGCSASPIFLPRDSPSCDSATCATSSRWRPDLSCFVSIPYGTIVGHSGSTRTLKNLQVLDVNGQVHRQETGLTVLHSPVYTRKVMNLGGLQNIQRLPTWDYVSKST